LAQSPLRSVLSRFGEQRARQSPARPRVMQAASWKLRLRAAADGDAFERRVGLRPALALAGVLAFASVRRTLAGALPFAGIDAGAVIGGLGLCLCSSQRTGGEHRRRRDDGR